MPNSIAAAWNRKADVILEAADACRDDEPVTRRSCLDVAMRKHGLMVHTREMIGLLLDKCRFFEHSPMKGWLEKVFPEHSADPEERVLRLAEETMELAQCEGVTRDQLHRLVDQVMDKPVGVRKQELGGVMVTLGSYCAVTGQDAHAAFSAEFMRCNDPEVIIKIQRKHQHKLVVSSKIR